MLNLQIESMRAQIAQIEAQRDPFMDSLPYCLYKVLRSTLR